MAQVTNPRPAASRQRLVGFPVPKGLRHTPLPDHCIRQPVEFKLFSLFGRLLP